MKLAFARALPIAGTELHAELDIAARSLASRGARLLITNRGSARWVLSCDGSLPYSSYVTQSATAVSACEVDFTPKYFVRRLPKDSGRGRTTSGIGISGVEVTSITALPLEELLHYEAPFAVTISIVPGHHPPISDQDGLVEVEIAADDRAVAEQIGVWLGGFVSEVKAGDRADRRWRRLTLVYTRELVYFFRPPLQSPAYFPEGVLSATPDLLARLKLEPELLTRHILICGSTGYGKTNTSKLLLDALLNTSRPIGLLVIDPQGEYDDFAAAHPQMGIQFVAAGRRPAQLGLLNVNPFLPAQWQTLGAHLDVLSNVFAVSGFRGAGTNLPAWMALLLSEFVFGMWRKKAGRPDTSPFSLKKKREVLDKTGAEVLEDGFLASPREGPSLLDSLCAYWHDHRDVIIEEMAGSERGAALRDLPAVITGRLNKLGMSALHRFDYSAQGRSLATLMHKRVVLSLEGASESDVDLLCSLVAVSTVEAALSGPRNPNLGTVLLIEEAHRVMLQPRSESAEYVRADHYLADTFKRAFRELRARGVAVIAVDQSPSTLIDEAFANTTVKIAHHLQSADDKKRIQDVFQLDGIDLATFEPGECVVKVGGSPGYRVKMPVWDATSGGA